MAYTRKQRYFKICAHCGTQFWTSLYDGKYCQKKCQYADYNTRAQRLSLKLTREQLEVILSLQDYFLRGYDRPPREVEVSKISER
jgi:hypothetical protein